MPGARAELVVGGRIATLAGLEGFGWAEALAIGEGSVIATGPRAAVEPMIGPGTRRLELGPEWLVLPGLTDAHLHLTDAALGETQLVVAGADLGATLEAVRTAHETRLAAGDPEGWVLGRGWTPQLLGGWPSADLLEAVAPGRPVALWGHDHHSRWASHEALRRAAITRATPDPPGGSIQRDSTGAPTGVLLEHACRLLDAGIPQPSEAELAGAILAYGRRLTALGVVGCHDPGEVTPEPPLTRGPALYARLARDGRLPLRVHGSLREQQLPRAAELGLCSGVTPDPADADDPSAVRAAARARVGWLKLFADGSLGSWTAALLEPYADGHGSGELLQSPEVLRDVVRQGVAAGLTPQIHAIGDRAVRVALDAIADAGSVRHAGLWPRLEHLQLVAAKDLGRLAGLRVAASVQPCHLISDADPARAAWPDRLGMAYRWRTLAATGVPLAFGTDAPVESPDPWPGIAVAISRRPSMAGDPFPGEERLTLARALRAAALDPVIIAGEEGRGGRLLSGHRADLIVVPAAILEAGAAATGVLAACRPALTLIDGEPAHEVPGFLS